MISPQRLAAGNIWKGVVVVTIDNIARTDCANLSYGTVTKSYRAEDTHWAEDRHKRILALS